MSEGELKVKQKRGRQRGKSEKEEKDGARERLK
jgi:hypothetical protein